MTLFVPEREDAASIKKPFCGCGLFIHFFYILYTMTVIIGMKESNWN
jgi:hypothetical protein